MSPKKSGARIAPLDAMRGLAALVVAIYHFRHFGGDVQTYPWAHSAVGQFIYDRGWAFVDFFFVLSGIVFTYRYYEPIQNKRIDAREFFVLRLSRLYPLHLLTLLVCAGIQWTCLSLGRPEIIYDHSNLYGFFLNLVYLQSGGFEETWTYNAPTWSVAVEVVAYVLFFVYASRSRRTYATASVCSLVVALAVFRMGWTYPLLNGNVSRGVIGFFVGSILFFAIRHFQAAGHQRRLALAAFTAMLAVFGLVFELGYDRFIGGNTLPLLFVVFPLVILSGLEFPPLAWIFSLRPLSFLGDLSYSVYLVHVPVQMVLIAIMRERHRLPPVTSKAFLFEFILIVLVVAFVVHRLFEVPARRWVRSRMGSASLPDRSG
jgi:peptidoglycan/LPS O-acetylase OafA/YrhL